MARFQFDKIFVNPTYGDVSEAIGAARDAANANARARRVSIEGPYGVVRRVEQEDCGWCEWSGGGVPNSYRQAAETSVVGVVWFTDAGGRRHVRVAGGRVAAPKSAFGRRDADVFGSSAAFEAGKTSHTEMVYPWLAVERVAKTRRRERDPQELALIDALAENPLDDVAWAALADWMDENPGEGCSYMQPGRMRHSAALARAINAGLPVAVEGANVQNRAEVANA